MIRYYSRIPMCKVCKKTRLNQNPSWERKFCQKCWKRCIQIEDGEWYYYGCFIQLSDHPSLYGKYEAWKDDDARTHIGRYDTMKEAKEACRENAVQVPKQGPHHFGWA